eukprot:CAMPEP_0202825404 /NCGR_PEP_ID=MMETSP1389-20130828/13016_1 /ASSEMBLY_ACC=CAM_ASM_000865 /TAXON_ID=302021 /ORGANISM="Rhodomonas sp., Strain CCMP768" /LENGTH=415 /DNA_ID=CAMNT_0049498633 /DNA_START=71 /DNA_END=1320 /DNA_ORIENTATION=+
MAMQTPEDPNLELKKKIRDAFSVFDREGKDAVDEREIGTILRSLSVFPTEKQLKRWILEIEEEEPTGYIVYEKFEVLAVRLLTEEAMSNKRNTEDEILAAFQALDTDKKGYLEADQLEQMMTTYGEAFRPEEIKEMMSQAVDVEYGRIYYEDYAELLANEYAPPHISAEEQPRNPRTRIAKTTLNPEREISPSARIVALATNKLPPQVKTYPILPPPRLPTAPLFPTQQTAKPPPTSLCQHCHNRPHLAPPLPLRLPSSGSGCGDALVELELVLDVRPHVLNASEGLEEGEELEETLVLGVAEPALDRDPVGQLVAEGLRGVVDDGDLGEVTAQHRQVLDVVVVDEDAGVAEDAVADELAVGVDHVEELVRVDLLRRREHNQLELVRQPLQKLDAVRPDLHPDRVILVLHRNIER